MTPRDIAEALFPGERMFDERKAATSYLERNEAIRYYYESHLKSLAEVLLADSSKSPLCK